MIFSLVNGILPLYDLSPVIKPIFDLIRNLSIESTKSTLPSWSLKKRPLMNGTPGDKMKTIEEASRWAFSYVFMIRWTCVLSDRIIKRFQSSSVLWHFHWRDFNWPNRHGALWKCNSQNGWQLCQALSGNGDIGCFWSQIGFQGQCFPSHHQGI